MRLLNSVLFALTMSVAATGSLQAHNARVGGDRSSFSFPKDAKYEEFAPAKGVAFYVPKKADTAADAEYVNITIKSKSQNGVNPSQVSIFNKDYKEVEYMNSKGEMDFSVPAGTYDMFVSFYGGTSYFVFKENITVEDGAVYEFDQEEACNDVTFMFFDETGKELFMDVYDGSKFLTAGTADSMSKLTSFVHKDYGSSALIISMGYMPKKYPMEFYINDVSDKYIVAHGANITANGVTYSYKCGLTSFAPCMKKIFDGSNLMKCTTEFDANQLMDSEDAVFTPGFNVALLWDGMSLVAETNYVASAAGDSKTVVNYIDCPESDEDSADKVNLIYAPILANYMEVEEDQWGKQVYYYGMTGCAMMGDKNGVKYVNAGADPDWGGFNVPEGLLDAKYYPGHPELSFERPDGEMTYPQTCPITSLRAMRYESDGWIDGWDRAFFVGRYGEMYEGESYLLYPYEDMLDDGSFVTSIDNRFVTVDGLQGHNTMEAHYDHSNADFIAPTIQMLTFKDAKGEITDRLQSAEGSKIIVMGGDFSYHMNWDVYLGYFTCGEAELEVSYSPFGMDEWQNLPVAEVPEKRFMPYFGNYYEGTLDDVACESDDQWFDVKLMIKDEAGNYQSQVVSPAFKILSGSGVTEMSAATQRLMTRDGDTFRYDGYADFKIVTTAGQTVRTSAGNEISVKDLSKGVYIIVANTADNGRIVKKIQL